MRKPEKPPFVPPTYNYSDILDELLKKGKYSDFVSLTESKYSYWDKWKYIAKDWDIDSKMLWGAVKSTRHGVRLYLKTLPEFNISSPALVQEYLH